MARKRAPTPLPAKQPTPAETPTSSRASSPESAPASQLSSLHIPDTQEREEEDREAKEKWREFLQKQEVGKAERMAAKMQKQSVENVASILDKYTHAVEVTHKAELEQRYAQLRDALAAQEAASASALATIEALSAEMEDAIGTLHSVIREVVAEDERRSAGFTSTIQGGIDGEQEALNKVGGQVKLW